MATIDEVVQQIVADVAAVTNVTRAHAYPPDSINQNFQALIYPSNIVWSWGETFGKKSVAFDVMIELSASIAADAARTVETLVPFADSIPAALFEDEFLNAQVVQWDTITGGIGRREPTGPIVLILTVTGCHIEDAL